jgi:hypothetical protein
VQLARAGSLENPGETIARLVQDLGDLEDFLSASHSR